jgi:hypothetical protein
MWTGLSLVAAMAALFLSFFYWLHVVARSSRGRPINALPLSFIRVSQSWPSSLPPGLVGRNCASTRSSVDNDIDAPGVPFLFVMLAQLSASAGERSGFSNDGTGSQKDWQALRRRTVVRKRR